MRNEEKKNFIKNTISVLITILALILIFYGGWNVFSILNEEKQEKDQANEKINEFKNSLGTVDYAPSVIKDEGEEEKVQFTSNDFNTIGIMTLEDLGVEAPISWMPANNFDGQQAVLSAYIGQDDSTPPLGTGSGSNSIFYSHSSIYSCAHCYFNDIDELKKGDIVKVLYYDNNEYMYIVYDVIPYLNPNAEGYNNYLIGDPSKEMITLVTCTDGKGEYRTVVYAERLK